MWLLKLHFAISILCLLTFVGFRTVFKQLIKDNGYETSEKKAKITAYWIFFIPILNLFTVLFLFVMLTIKKEVLDEWVEKNKKNNENKEN